jgi:hypothetical protein
MHKARVVGLGEEIAQAICDRGWQNPRFGADKRLGTVDARRAADDVADPHQLACSVGDQ